MEIRFFKPEGPHGFLSNYFRWPFILGGRRWENVEHCYQAAKFDHNPKLLEAICRHSHPDAAKSFSHEHAGNCRPDWERVKLQVMRKAVWAKFEQSAFLTRELLATEDAELIEDSPSDTFWGLGRSGAGANYLGKLFMELRTSLGSPSSLRHEPKT
jgi:ribA/ribD-fused uncharacterized protein